MNQLDQASTQAPRQVAIQVLTNVLLQQGSLSTQLNRLQTQVTSDQQALFKELCFGVCRQFPKLNSIALSLLAHPFEEKDTDLYAVLLLGLYQLSYMKTPDHAAVNESVEACRLLNKDWATKLINAVLRRYQREELEIIDNLMQMPSVEFNHPKWLVKRYKKHWPNAFEQIIEASNVHPPMCIRVNLDRVSRETYQLTLSELGIETTQGGLSDASLYLSKAVSVNQLPGFDDGLCSVQDEAAQLSAQILNPTMSERILDACAAPGGKTGHLLECLSRSQSEEQKSNSVLPSLTAIELEAWRLEKIESNLDRLGYCAELMCADASQTEEWWDNQAYDKILLDVPCSATGVIRRNPDIKLNRKPADIEELIVIQKQILNKVWATLKPNGYLLYATCSLMPEENEQQIAAFLSEQSDASEIKLNHLNANLSLNWGLEVSHGKQLFPTLNGNDGFYYCLLQKSA
ncbi:16S rRNA (cytosine(967)-C(5))-methyltransferase RsmB [Marinomonas posidonica]|uniref:16S rRNA (cytosine(967)-C(5))-methyltransferase n=1 Tax=Marinomonas posidonica (strain CECT 7376 / NCIMB 14433 / IVIA-Po-181) TaxID=491952 RepID=F6CYV6_MARPP|nr:16S rRNA (cytosine(967)-C(5))-methyltransferase RsmB [Marinomonas posidonica]AEF53083.1 sun protein [Marinomonas posidonica IVIA-Po-181]